MRRALLKQLMAVTALLLTAGDLGAQQGSLTVRNGTDSNLYVVLNSRNQGYLAAHSYQVYATSLGDVKVEVYKGYSSADPYARKWVRLTASYPCGEVDFTDYDF